MYRNRFGNVGRSFADRRGGVVFIRVCGLVKINENNCLQKSKFVRD